MKTHTARQPAVRNTGKGTEVTDKTYVSIAQIGKCKVCGDEDDLRFGSCFDCADFVAGEQISPTTHKLWDSRNPSNIWYASETHN